MPTVAEKSPVLQQDTLQNSRFNQGAQALPPLLQGFSYGAQVSRISPCKIHPCYLFFI
jgi:hypothetical protein